MPAFSRGEVREFIIRHAPYVHNNGARFDYLLLVHHDGGALAIRVSTAPRILEMIAEFEPDVVQAGDTYCEPLVALLEREGGGQTLH